MNRDFLTKFKYMLMLLWLFVATETYAMISPEALGDSLNAAMDWPACVGPIKVRSIRMNKGVLSVRTNAVLAGKAMDMQEVQALKRRIVRWVNGSVSSTRGSINKIQVYSDGYELDKLAIVHQPSRGVVPIKSKPTQQGGRGTIALWASHGRYLKGEDAEDARYLWQRARMWCTVEDRLTTEFSTRVATMLEYAGFTVLQPRTDPRKDAHTIGQSGLPTWMEGAVYHLREANLPDTVTDYTKGESEYKNDLFCRTQWVNHLIEKAHTPIDMVVAIHTDGYDEAGDSAMVGTLALYHGLENRQMAHLIQRQIVSDMRELGISHWPERRLRGCNYVECREPKTPSMIIEIASHKDISDARYLLDPNYQNAIARSIYKGIARSLYGYGTTIAPLPPRNLDATLRNGRALITWDETVDPIEPSAQAEHYILTDNTGRSWDCRQKEMEVEIKPEQMYQFTVRAVNNGGSSAPSIALGICIADNATRHIRVINAFDRISGPVWYSDSLRAGIEPGQYGIADGYNYALIGRQTEYRRSQPWVSDDNNGWGECSIEWQHLLTAGNTHDYHLLHAEVWREQGYTVVATCNQHLDSADATRYEVVDLIYGRQIARNQQLAIEVEHYYRQGGRVIASGSHIGTGPMLPLSSWTKLQTHTGSRSVAVEPNESTLYCNEARALVRKKDEHVVGRWQDNGLPAIIRGNRYTLIGCMLESINDWKNILIYEEKEPSITGKY